MVPDRNGGHDVGGAAGTPEPSGDPSPVAPGASSHDDSAGPLDRLDVAPAAAPLADPGDQRRLREQERGLDEHEREAGPDDPPAGGGVG
jgi:hypothetical protein